MAIDDAIGVYHQRPNAVNVEKLAKAITAWAIEKGIDHFGNIVTVRNSAVVNQLVEDVGKLRGGRRAMAGLPAAVRAGQNPNVLATGLRIMPPARGNSTPDLDVAPPVPPRGRAGPPLRARGGVVPPVSAPTRVVRAARVVSILPPAPPVSVIETPRVMSPEQWVAVVTRELNQFKTYACMDCTTFVGAINPAVTEAVLARRLAAINAGGLPPPLSVQLPGAYNWTPGSLQMRYNFVTTQKVPQAECTTFGYLAAYVLTNQRPIGPRVEMVARSAGRSSHVFVLVGRAGGDPPNGRIPADWEAVVVDGWAASLGYACVYPSRRHFEGAMGTGMATNLQLVMAREDTSSMPTETQVDDFFCGY